MTNTTNVPAYLANHHAAMSRPRPGFEAAIVGMVHAWSGYAAAARAAYDGPIGTDYVLGPEWLAMGRAIIGLLNGQTGRLDCGTLDALIRDTARAEGFEEEV